MFLVLWVICVVVGVSRGPGRIDRPKPGSRARHSKDDDDEAFGRGMMFAGRNSFASVASTMMDDGLTNSSVSRNSKVLKDTIQGISTFVPLDGFAATSLVFNLTDRLSFTSQPRVIFGESGSFIGLCRCSIHCSSHTLHSRERGSRDGRCAGWGLPASFLVPSLPFLSFFLFLLSLFILFPFLTNPPCPVLPIQEYLLDWIPV